MRELEAKIKNRALQLLNEKAVERVIGWVGGVFDYDVSPMVFNNIQDLEQLVYNKYCGSSLSKYLIAEGSKVGKTLALLKPCDTYSFNQLLSEHRIKREKVYVLGLPCSGCEDNNGPLLKCQTCKSNEFQVADEIIEASIKTPTPTDRFAEVAWLESLSPEERFNFWRKELSRCIRCNACRNVCPACTCIKCIFDNAASGVATKANADVFEENLFHIIRALHVAGRCSDCGECSRVCPQKIPLHLLNRKFIKEINTIYGEYQAGKSPDSLSPLNDFAKDDPEVSIIHKGGADNARD